MRRLTLAVCAGLWFGTATAQTCPVDPSIVYTDKEVLALRLFAIRPVLFDLNKLNQFPKLKLQLSDAIRSQARPVLWIRKERFGVVCYFGISF